MKETFDLQKHIEQGVEKIVSDTIKATLKNPKESAFMVRFAAASRRASKTRMKLEQEDREHHEQLQPALRGLLLPLQQRHCRRSSRRAAEP